MEQIGLVRKVKNGKIELEVRRVSACGGGCSSCSSSCDSPGHILQLPNKVNAKVGDLVEIKGDSKKVLKYATITYMLPLAFLIIGTIIGTLYFKSKGLDSYELLSLLSGIISLIISSLIIKQIDKKIGKEGNEALEVTRIL